MEITEGLHRKPSNTTEILYAKRSNAVNDHIFHEDGKPGIHCQIQAYCHQPDHGLKSFNLKDKRALEDFCELSKSCRRSFFIDTKFSRDRLLVTRELFDKLIESCQVFRAFLEFIISFGSVDNDEPNEYRPPQHIHRKISHPKNDITQTNDTAGTALNSAGHLRESCNTGPAFKDTLCGYECAYEIRYVAEKKNQVKWSLRQMAVYHSVRPTDSENSSDRQDNLSSTLIAICAPDEMKAQIRKYTSDVTLKSGTWAEPFRIHLLILHELMGTWRPYLRWLTVEIANSTASAIFAGSKKAGKEIDARLLSQQLKGLQDDVEHGALTIEALLDTIESIAGSYQRHARKTSSPWEDDIAEGFQDKLRLAKLIQRDFSTLREKAASTANLYSRLSEVQAAEDTAVSIEDSKIVKVLSFFSVFYLPTAILGNFFSSSFVEVSQVDILHPRMRIVENWWIYWAVIGSFTLATCLALGAFGDLIGWWHVRGEEETSKPGPAARDSKSLSFRVEPSTPKDPPMFQPRPGHNNAKETGENSV